jgi:hypothetical protein
MGYSNDNGTTITPYTIDQIDKEGGYNWFRPLNTIFSLLDQKSNDIKNFINFINGIDEGWWFKIGAKQTSHDERDSMESWMPDTDLNQFDTLCGAIPDYPQH